MSRLKYYNYFAGLSRYDAGLSINHYDYYNADILNPSKQINPNKTTYDFNMNDLVFDINDSHDLFLMMVDEQIDLHLSVPASNRSKKVYKEN